MFCDEQKLYFFKLRKYFKANQSLIATNLQPSSIENENLLKTEIERLRIELKENETLINDLKENESIYLSEIKDLKNTLRKGLDLSKRIVEEEDEEEDGQSLLKNNENETTKTTDFYFDTSDHQNKTDLEKEILFNIDLEIVELNNELNKSTVNSVLGGSVSAGGDDGVSRRANDDSIFKQKYLELFEAVESMTHPAFVEFQNELNKQFYEEYEELKNECARKLETELQTFKVIYLVFP